MKKYTKSQFAKNIRNKYPGYYDNLSDDKLIKIWLEKFPKQQENIIESDSTIGNIGKHLFFGVGVIIIGVIVFSLLTNAGSILEMSSNIIEKGFGNDISNSETSINQDLISNSEVVAVDTINEVVPEDSNEEIVLEDSNIEVDTEEKSVETGAIDYEKAVKDAFTPQVKRQYLQWARAFAGGNQYYPLKDCAHCNGKGIMETCDFCNGKGNVYCRTCKGKKYTNDGRVCIDCSGNGLVLCGYCDGKRVNVKCSHQILNPNG